MMEHRDYNERVYAGVLGKIIGVYLGRPFEGWTYDKIMESLGEINYYVHDKLGKALVVTDDDISGTFTFLRALSDYNYDKNITARQIGETWLNYLIEGKTILWWGGLGNSTEHTAYLRLKEGIPAPRSGSIELNGQAVAEQIGAQIFIDGWGMVCPGDPELAASLAKRAGSVSHDGEAVMAAQLLAAMQAQAFVESDLDKLLDVGLSFVAKDSTIFRMISDIREWHGFIPDWREARQLLDREYGYHKYPGNCHIVPNHGLIILSLLYGQDSFHRSLMIVNTSGWDTDCNSANVGCLLGIKNGLAGIEDGPDFRTPVADRLYMPTADGGRAISDAVIEAYHIINTKRQMVGEKPLHPKGGARFHFEFPGAVQGFTAEAQGANLSIKNVEGHSLVGTRSLGLFYDHVTHGCSVRAKTPCFIPELKEDIGHYTLLASPSLYPGQTLRATVTADKSNNKEITCQLYVGVYNSKDQIGRLYGPQVDLAPGASHDFCWMVPEQKGQPIAEVGFELTSESRADGVCYLDYLTWHGTPQVDFIRPVEGGSMWRRAWVDGIDHFFSNKEPYHIVKDSGLGMLIQGTREWEDYVVSSTVTPGLASLAGLAARVQGMRRYYALVLEHGNRAKLIKGLDGVTTLAECDFDWEFNKSYPMKIQVCGNRIQGWIDGKLVGDITDQNCPLSRGAVALYVKDGSLTSDSVSVAPLAPSGR